MTRPSMKMTTVYHTSGFQILEGAFATRESRCFHVQPGVVDFPGRCEEPPGHAGTHRARASYGWDGSLIPVERWENEE